jgi:TatD DNase family protein
MLLETDAPFLAPQPYRGRRNEPAYIPVIARKIAELHSQPLEVIAEVTFTNADRLLGWR